ncbi:WGR domain-containing protein, partial [Lentzea sp. NPDC060358]|uniref:WGR domain-containing protein n=1 Tax=Lentzea sp. NPDC060358 TaxID=3347103 RepID=UPI0036668D92
MRRWELVAGSSAKFWEIDREGTEVTVRFGRLQTNGQTQTKELDTEEAAEAHVAKLVADKEKKGYRPVGTTEENAGSAAPATRDSAPQQPAPQQPAPAQPASTQPASTQPA